MCSTGLLTDAVSNYITNEELVKWISNIFLTNCVAVYLVAGEVAKVLLVLRARESDGRGGSEWEAGGTGAWKCDRRRFRPLHQFPGRLAPTLSSRGVTPSPVTSPFQSCARSCNMLRRDAERRQFCSHRSQIGTRNAREIQFSETARTGSRHFGPSLADPRASLVFDSPRRITAAQSL